MLEVGKLGDRGGDDLAGELVLDQSGQPGEPRIPLTHGLDEGLHVPILPEVPFVFDLLENADGLGRVEEPNHGEVAADEVLYAADVRVAGELGLAERVPQPAVQAGGQLAVFGLDDLRVASPDRDWPPRTPRPAKPRRR